MGCGMSKRSRYHYAVSDDPYCYGAPLQPMGPRCGRKRGFRRGRSGHFDKRGRSHKRPLWAAPTTRGPPGRDFASSGPVPEGFREPSIELSPSPVDDKFEDPSAFENIEHYHYSVDSSPPRYSNISGRRG